MSGIFTLAVACVGGRYLTQDYRFVLEVRADSTLGELASCILRTLAFDSEHLSEFYLANGPYGGRKSWFTADGEWDPEGGDDLWACQLARIFPLQKHKKLFYAYDFGASWRFQITKKGREKIARQGLDYPRLVAAEGVKPSQYGA